MRDIPICPGYIHAINGDEDGELTWKTLGALTREARAEDRVAEKIPAVMMGPKPDTMLMT